MIVSTVKHRVEWVYISVPSAVEFDCVLLAVYENYFGKLSHQEVSSVKRSGRFWRQKKPWLFKRTDLKSSMDAEQKMEVLEAFT